MAKKSDRKPPTVYMMEEGKRMKDFRESLHMTQPQFAELIDKSVVQVGRYERGLSQMPDGVKDFLHREYRVDMNYIVSGDKAFNLLEIDMNIHKISDDVLWAYYESIHNEVMHRRAESKKE